MMQELRIYDVPRASCESTKMPGDRCVVCGNTRAKDASVFLHRFPKDPERRQLWLHTFHLQEDTIKPHMCMCSRHFRGGDATSTPNLGLGKRFTSPKKRWTPRAKCTQQRNLVKQQSSFSKSPTPVPSQSTLEPQGESLSGRKESPMIVSVGEVLSSDHQMRELYSENQDEKSGMSADPSCRTDASLSFSTAAGPSGSDAQITINTALLARVEVLESENQHLDMKLQRRFRVEDITHDDNLVRMYTGFSSYVILLAFFEFLGPSVHRLNYWGSKGGEQKRN